MSHLLPILIMIKPTYLIGTFILFFTIHLHFLILMTCRLHMTLLTPLLSLLQTFMRLSFHWMSKNLLEQTKFLQEYFEVVLRLFVNYSIICSHFHCVMVPYPIVGKFIKSCLSSKLAIIILQKIIAQFPYYLTHPKF